ncbi:MAG: hypothetical protein JRJ29_09980, partial [Deltaproteobacteria bacterium]|nr:hypothetical protein [Deltaproteobacteria bacterium]
HGECAKACPYGVIELNPERDYFAGERVPFDDIRMARVMHPPGKASTCNLCVHRIEQGREPACVEECPSKVILFGDLDDPNSSIQEKLHRSEGLLESARTEPKVSYICPNSTLKQVEERIAGNPRMELL